MHEHSSMLLQQPQQLASCELQRKEWKRSISWIRLFKKKNYYWCGPFLKSLLNLLQYCFYVLGFFGREACGCLAPRPEIGSTPPATEVEVLATGPPGKSCGQDSDVPKEDSRGSGLGNLTPVLMLEDQAIKLGELFLHNEREIQIIE